MLYNDVHEIFGKPLMDAGYSFGECNVSTYDINNFTLSYDNNASLSHVELTKRGSESPVIAIITCEKSYGVEHGEVILAVPEAGELPQPDSEQKITQMLELAQLLSSL